MESVSDASQCSAESIIHSGGIKINYAIHFGPSQGHLPYTPLKCDNDPITNNRFSLENKKLFNF